MYTGEKGRQWTVEDIRTLLCQLPGVSAAGVKLADDAPDEDMEEIEEIHILANTSRNAKQIVRDVQSALYAAYNIQIDHRIVSVAQMALDLSCKPKAPARVRYKGMGYEEIDEKCVIRVTLEYDGIDYCGQAAYPNAKAESYRLRMIAKATLDAIGEMVGDEGIYSLLDVQKVTIAGVPLVVVLLECTAEENCILSGSACRVAQEMQSVVRATLDAVNRNLGKHMHTD